MTNINQKVIDMVKYIAKKNGYDKIEKIYFDPETEGICFKVNNGENVDGIYRIDLTHVRMVPFVPSDDIQFYQLVVQPEKLIYPIY